MVKILSNPGVEIKVFIILIAKLSYKRMKLFWCLSENTGKLSELSGADFDFIIHLHEPGMVETDIGRIMKRSVSTVARFGNA